MRKKKRQLTHEEELRHQAFEELCEREKVKESLKLKSPCLKGRLKHYFREPNTRSLTPDLKCKWCGKTVAQVRTEQKGARIITAECPNCFHEGPDFLFYEKTGFVVCPKCKGRWKV